MSKILTREILQKEWQTNYTQHNGINGQKIQNRHICDNDIEMQRWGGKYVRKTTQKIQNAKIGDCKNAKTEKCKNIEKCEKVEHCKVEIPIPLGVEPKSAQYSACDPVLAVSEHRLLH